MHTTKNEKCSLKEDLILRRISPSWCLTLKKDENCTVNNIINFILEEDVGQIRTGIPLKKIVANNQLEALKAPLFKIISKKGAIEKQFRNVVDQTAKTWESGRSVGWSLIPHLKRLIPQDLVGGSKNKITLLKNIRRSFLFGKVDLIPINLLTNNVDVKTIVWLKHFNIGSMKHRLLTALVKWLWRVTKRLLATCYFVSETQGCPNQLAYIPKNIWKSHTDRQFNSQVHSGILRPLTLSESQMLLALRNPATLRWLPKNGGLRPIISVRGDKQCSNTICAKNLLRSLLEKHNCNFNSSRLYNSWIQLVKRHCLSGNNKKLYFVACDIHDAYGSIRQDKMLHILEDEILSQYGPKTGTNQFSKEISTIKNAITCQTLKMSKNLYLLTRGLSQAMPLSASLCNLYLSHLDRTSLALFTADPNDMLIRAVDDYLYVTPDRARAELFLNTMHNGFSDYGLKINPSKTQTNLCGDLEILYFGYLINSANLEVYVRFTQGLNVSFRNSMTFKDIPIFVLESKLRRIPQQKLNLLTTDRRYMSVEGVARNVFHIGCVMACSLISILELTLPSEQPDSDQLVSLIKRRANVVAQRVYKLGANLAIAADKEHVMKEDIFICLTKREVYWIVVRAFFMCMAHAASVNSNLSDSLVASLSFTEGNAVKQVRPQIVKLLSSVLLELPRQFKNIYCD